ncbi:MAG: 50S ribosomal protein L6 [Bacilli bacterium]|nr:50S ribosomal protein L6 [Bacilli bacterium]
MSRIGNKHIVLPAGVTVTVNGNVATVTGPKGTLNVTLNDGVSLKMEENTIICTRRDEEKQTKQNHGTTRANLNNAIVGVSAGYKKSLEMRGIGFKAQMQGNDVVLWAGYSHTVTIKPNEGVKISVQDLTTIHVEGIDKQAVGQTAARIREVRRPEPYLGKGIRYVHEYVATKEGKRAAAGGTAKK